jgi:hypothetical protein
MVSPPEMGIMSAESRRTGRLSAKTDAQTGLCPTGHGFIRKKLV